MHDDYKFAKRFILKYKKDYAKFNRNDAEMWTTLFSFISNLFCKISINNVRRYSFAYEIFHGQHHFFFYLKANISAK